MDLARSKWARLATIAIIAIERNRFMLCSVKRQDFEAWEKLVGGRYLEQPNHWTPRKKVIVRIPDTNTEFMLTYHPWRRNQGPWSTAMFNLDRDIELLEAGPNKVDLKRKAKALIALML